LTKFLKWDLNPLPVPAEIIIYTRQEWERLRDKGEKIRSDAGKPGCLDLPEPILIPLQKARD
jgi:hypothetical protein